MSLTFVRRASMTAPRAAKALPTLPTNFSALLPAGYEVSSVLIPPPIARKSKKPSAARDYLFNHYRNVIGSTETEKTPVLLFFQHKDFSTTEWSALREEVSKVWKKEMERLKKLDPAMKEVLEDEGMGKPKITVVRKTMLAPVLRSLKEQSLPTGLTTKKGKAIPPPPFPAEQMAPVFDYLNVLPGPKAVLTLPFLDPRALLRILKVCQKHSKTPNPRLEGKTQAAAAAAEEEGGAKKAGRWVLIDEKKREKERFFFLGGLVQGIPVNEAQVLEVANGPGLRESQAMIVGLLEGNMQQLVGTVESVQNQLAWTLEAAVEKMGEGAGEEAKAE
ncbi:hypothetical protein BT69DRAFT_1288595 [Atractiella rhizophila]|nr:hypothetical protein BT69DRAFT_1288595 [Atractiella rhizophila]